MISAEDYLAQCEAETDYWYRVETAKIKARGSVFPVPRGRAYVKSEEYRLDRNQWKSDMIVLRKAINGD